MSYILDALKRAEAQRGRGAVPGLHDQPGATLPTAPAGRARSTLWLAIGAAMLCVLGAGGWLLASRTSAPTVAPVAAPVAAPVVAPVVAPAAAPVAQAPVPAPVAPAPPAQTPTPATQQQQARPVEPAQAASAARPTPTTTPVTPQTQMQTPAQTQAQPQPKTQAQTQPATPAPAASVPAIAASAPAPRVYSRDELPADARALLGQVNLSGGAYSENASHRMVIANGLVLHEGERLSPDVTVEEIRPRGVVLGLRGYRVLLPF